MSTRDFHGYRQHIEEFETPNRYGTFRVAKRWMFYVCSFGDNTANVMLSNGSQVSVPIDTENRITILGRKYSRSYWNH